MTHQLRVHPEGRSRFGRTNAMEQFGPDLDQGLLTLYVLNLLNRLYLP